LCAIFQRPPSAPFSDVPCPAPRRCDSTPHAHSQPNSVSASARTRSPKWAARAQRAVFLSRQKWAPRLRIRHCRFFSGLRFRVSLACCSMCTCVCKWLCGIEDWTRHRQRHRHRHGTASTQNMDQSAHIASSYEYPRLAAPCRLSPLQVLIRRRDRTHPGTHPHAQPRATKGRLWFQNTFQLRCKIVIM
jgi:hypothetical protein